MSTRASASTPARHTPRQAQSGRRLDRQVESSAVQTYDPDFSPPSSSESSWESDSSYSCSVPPHDPEIDRLIPRAFSYPPVLGPDTWRWHCEFPKCEYLLDMLNLSEQDTTVLASEEARRLRLGGWPIDDEWIQRRFLYMISCHRDQHLGQLGIEVKRGGKKQKQVCDDLTFVLKLPSRSRSVAHFMLETTKFALSQV